MVDVAQATGVSAAAAFTIAYGDKERLFLPRLRALRKPLFLDSVRQALSNPRSGRSALTTLFNGVIANMIKGRPVARPV